MTASGPPLATTANMEVKVLQAIAKGHKLYNMGAYSEALECCEFAYENDAYRTDNLLLIGAVHFQLRNFSEAIFYNQQCIRVDANFAEGYSNLGNALKELGDVEAAVQFYLKAIKLKPRYCDAYNNLASAYMQLGRSQEGTGTKHTHPQTHSRTHMPPHMHIFRHWGILLMLEAGHEY